MSKKALVLRVCKFFCVYIGVFFILMSFLQISQIVKFSFEINQEKVANVQVFQDKDGSFYEENSKTYNLTGASNKHIITFDYDINSKLIRIDLENIVNKVEIDKLIFKINFNKYTFNPSKDELVYLNNVLIDEMNNSINLTTAADDPYLVVEVPNSIKEQLENELFYRKLIVSLISSLLISIIAFILLVKRTIFYEFIYTMYRNKGLLFRLVKNDFKTRYAGSLIGFAWAIIQPIITILVFWFVFQIGLKVTAIDNNVPFAIWFIAGIIPWFFFSDSISNTSNSFTEYSYLVKKVIFDFQIIPLIKIVSSLLIHLLFVIVLMFIYLGYDFNLSIYNIQIIYYILCNLTLAITLSYIFSVLTIFLKDLGQVIAILLQIGMWITPIMWSEKILKGAMVWVIKLNPMYYVVEGFRNSLFYEKWFFEDVNLMIYFWSFVALAFIVGTFVFRKTSKHFADVL